MATMKRYLITLLSASLLLQQAAWSRPQKESPPQRDRGTWNQMSRKTCEANRNCPDSRRLQELQLREAARNGDIGFDPARHPNRMMPPPPDGHPQTIPSKPNFWQDKHRQELEHSQSE